MVGYDLSSYEIRQVADRTQAKGASAYFKAPGGWGRKSGPSRGPRKSAGAGGAAAGTGGGADLISGGYSAARLD